MDVYGALAKIADSAGAAIGVTDLSPFEAEAERIESRVADGLHGGLSFTYANARVAAYPAVSFPWASSIVVVAVPYLVDGDGVDVGRTVARFADGDRYDRLRGVLASLGAVIEGAGRRVEIVFDDDRLIDRALAVRAGVGWSGVSTMVLTPRYGPWILIGSIVTDASLEVTAPMRRTCGTCTACQPACPTGAIIAPGVLDARLCIAAILQRRGSIERDLRPAIGGRIYGCDDCLVACPPGDRHLERFDVKDSQVTPLSVLSATDRELDSSFHHWYVPSRRMRFLRRNALVALGNTGDESALGVLSGYVGHPDALLAEHAAWAIGRIGGRAARAICEKAVEQVTDQTVHDELVRSLTDSAPNGVYADVVIPDPDHRSKESVE